MEENKRIFVDTNYWVALFNPKDALHSRAITVSSRLTEEKTRLCVSSFIFLEVATILSQKCGKEVSRVVGTYLLEDPYVQILHIDEPLQEKSWRIFQEIQSKNMSFVDCSILAVMQEEGIKELLTFDTTDFKKLEKGYRFRLRALKYAQKQ